MTESDDYIYPKEAFPKVANHFSAELKFFAIYYNVNKEVFQAFHLIAG